MVTRDLHIFRRTARTLEVRKQTFNDSEKYSPDNGPMASGRVGIRISNQGSSEPARTALHHRRAAHGKDSRPDAGLTPPRLRNVSATVR